MKAGIFDPYLNILGGGERYCASVAEALLKQNWKVDIFWPDQRVVSRLAQRFALDLNGAKTVPNIFSRKGDFYSKWKTMKNYDLIFYLSDGSVPLLLAKKNLLHFQVPFVASPPNKLATKIKLKQIDEVVCNSSFTKSFIDPAYKVRSKILYPPVDVTQFAPQKKRNLILVVSRFSQALHAKKQEVLIQAFAKLGQENIKNWQLVFLGGLQPQDQKYFQQLQKQAQGLNVIFAPNISFAKLQSYYSQAKIFWHAAGFGEDEQQHPERVEHFGITTVEAMASGCVPLVVPKGGLKEIVTNQQCGYFWQTEEELVKQTLNLIQSEKQRVKIAQQAVVVAQKFSKSAFAKHLNEILS